MSKVIDVSQLKIERFDLETHDRTAFCCITADSLQEYLRGDDFIRDVVSLKILGGWVAVDRDNVIKGYYTLGMRTVNVSQIPNPEEVEYSFKTLNFVMLSRIATCDELRGLGYGQALLYDAVKRAYEYSEALGGQGVYLEARNEKVISIYENFGFACLPSDPKKMIFIFKDNVAYLQG